MWRRVLVGCFVLSLAQSAKADVFVIAPPHFAGTDGEGVSDAIVRVIQHELTAEHRVLSPLEGAALVQKEERVWCRGGACAERYRQAAKANAAIVVRVVREEAGNGLASSFQIGIQPSIGVEYTKGAFLTEGPLLELAATALRDVLREYFQGPGPWLELVGSPEGAAIFVDGRAVGTLPLTLAVPLGSHQINVKAETFAPATMMVALETVTDRRRLEFRLEPERFVSVQRARPDSVKAGSAPATARQSSLWTDPWFYVGAASALGAAAGSVMGTVWIPRSQRDGACEMRDAWGDCRRGRHVGPRSSLVLGVGIPVAAAGLLLSGWRVAHHHREKRAMNVNVAVSKGSVGFTMGGSL